MKKKYLSLLASFLLLTGCTNSPEGYKVYFGNMIVSSATKSTELLSMKTVVDKRAEPSSQEYKADIYVVTYDELSDFFSDAKNGVVVPTSEQESDPLTEREKRIYFLVEIPLGYSVVRRENRQGVIYGESEESLLTDNFYCYTTRMDLFYCFLDLTTDDTQTEDYTYAYYFDVNADLSIVAENIRILFDDAEVQSE